jgi:hypothetical protein
MNTKPTGLWLVALAATFAGLGCSHGESRTVEPRHPAPAEATPQLGASPPIEAATQAEAPTRATTPTATALPIYVEHAPSKAYRELGLLQAKGTGAQASQAAMLGSLRERGKTMGCDAVTDVTVDVGERKAHAIGVCVQWVDGGLRQSRPLPLSERR